MLQKNLKTLVIGNQGFIGKHFFDFYKTIDPMIIGTHYKNSNYLIDLLNPDITDLPIKASEYSWALIACGNAKIASCESNKRLSYLVNVGGIVSLVRQFLRMNIKPIIISTDYVFDGIKGNYREEDLINPLNEYGRQRVQLEKEAYKICKGQCLILRMSKIFTINVDNTSFFNEIAKNLLKGMIVRAAFDQVFSPILIDDLITAVLALQEKNASGIFHVCGRDAINRCEVALQIAKLLKIDSELIERISLDSLNESFVRPKNTSMDYSKLANTISFNPKAFKDCIEKFVDKYSIHNKYKSNLLDNCII